MDIVFVDKPTNWKFNDLTKEKFNRLTVLGFGGIINKKSYWWAECDCKNKNVSLVYSGHLKSGHTQSCGCLQKERTVAAKTIHGKYYSREYKSYKNAKARCEDPNNIGYCNYGGRGIQFKFNSFEDFYAYIGDKPEPKKSYSLGRKDNDGHYEFGNVEWENKYDQVRNTRENHWITYNNQTKCLKDWAKFLDISYSTLNNRLNGLNWCTECAFTLPVQSAGYKIKGCAKETCIQKQLNLSL